MDHVAAAGSGRVHAADMAGVRGSRATRPSRSADRDPVGVVVGLSLGISSAFARLVAALNGICGFARINPADNMFVDTILRMAGTRGCRSPWPALPAAAIRLTAAGSSRHGKSDNGSKRRKVWLSNYTPAL